MPEITKMPGDETKDRGENPGDMAEIKELLAELLAETRRTNRREARHSNSGDNRWLNSRSAAAYCDYSLDQFRELAREYQIPKHGPNLSRYDREELDQWIRDPFYFRNQKPARAESSKYKYREIQNVLLRIVEATPILAPTDNKIRHIGFDGEE
ncbi:MAG: hypothetical protein ABFD66_07695 [Smithella sp.]